jgi:hypothetical protein
MCLGFLQLVVKSRLEMFLPLILLHEPRGLVTFILSFYALK